MAKKNITLAIEERVYDLYRKYTKEKGLMVSKQVEIFMEEQLKKND